MTGREILQRIAQRCEDAVIKDNELRARCPAHNGTSDNSLKATISSDHVLLYCYGTCNTNDVLAALGMSYQDLFLNPKKSSSSHRVIAATYDYYNTEGTLLFQVLRYLPRGFKQRRPDGSGGWVWKLDGVKRVLYRLPELLQAVKGGERIYIPEGEKDVENLRKLGLAATCNAGGAGQWRNEFSEYLRGSSVVVLPDNDDSGRKHGVQVARALLGIAASVKLVELPDLPHKGDVSDWLAKGGTREQLEALVAGAPEYEGAQQDDGGPDAAPTPQEEDHPWQHIKHLDDFLKNRIEMPEGIVRELVFSGGITVVAAPSGVGKSVIAHIIAYELARGGVYRGQTLSPARVLLVDTDNPMSLVQDRLLHVCAQYDIDLYILTREHTPTLLQHKKWEAMPAEQYDVVLLDSFGGATPGVSEKEGAKLQQALNTLKHVADRGPGVFVLDNTTKSAEQYRGRGEKVERVDAFFEIRDVTNWEPDRQDWWENLPDAGDHSWQQRTTRRRRAPKIRLAVVCRKFRWGAEPDPFILEVSFDTKPWSFRDITDDIGKQAERAVEMERRERQAKFERAVETLAAEIERRFDEGEPALGKREAEEHLYEEFGRKQHEGGLTHRQVRNLIDAHDAAKYPSEGRWVIHQVPGAHGTKAGVFSIRDELRGSENDVQKTQSDNSNKNNDPNTPVSGQAHFTCVSGNDPHNPTEKKKVAVSSFLDKDNTYTRDSTLQDPYEEGEI